MGMRNTWTRAVPGAGAAASRAGVVDARTVAKSTVSTGSGRPQPARKATRPRANAAPADTGSGAERRRRDGDIGGSLTVRDIINVGNTMFIMPPAPGPVKPYGASLAARRASGGETTGRARP